MFYKPLMAVGIPGALGFAIIILTATIKLALSPINLKQMQSAKKMQAIKPELDILVKKHKDKKKLQEEQLKLFKKNGINPAAGCLPALLQMPVIFALYRVFYNILGNGNLTQLTSEINKIIYFPFLKIKILEVDFFGINLGIKPSEWQKYGIWLLAIPAITAILSFYQSKIMTVTPATVKAVDDKKTGKDKKSGSEDFSNIMQTQMKYVFPMMIGWISFGFPAGLSLYWNTFTVFGILQQLQINKKEN